MSFVYLQSITNVKPNYIIACKNVKIDYVCQKFSYFAKISCTNNIENGTKEKWGVAESLRANPIFVPFSFVGHVYFCLVLLIGVCLSGGAKRHHLYRTSTRLNAKLYQNNNLNNFQELNLLKSNTNIQFVCYNMHIINGDYYGKGLW